MVHGDSHSYSYLDWASTAPLMSEAFEAMLPHLKGGYETIFHSANANSLHSPGRVAFTEMEDSRSVIASSIGATRPNEIIFTSGATESDNMALFGLARAQRSLREQKGNHNPCKIIIAAIEHHAILLSAKRLQSEGFELIVLPPDKNGYISPDDLRDVVDHNTVLVSIQTANNEIGTIQPIKQLACIAHHQGALFHTDATQAYGKIPFNVSQLDIDAASISAHKIGGPKGVGALYLKRRIRIEPLLYGGGQEDGRRSTTQNIAGIVGFAAAAEVTMRNLSSQIKTYTKLRDMMIEHVSQLRGIKPVIDYHADYCSYLPTIASFLVSDYESETLILRLDDEGVAISGGSACASHSLKESHVLKAIGIPQKEALSFIRASIGFYTTEQDVLHFFEALKRILS